MLALDGTFLVIFLSFLIFMFLMNSLFFKPVLQIKYEREDTIEAGRKAAEDAASKTAQVTREYQKQLADARHKAQQLIQEKRTWAKNNASEQVSKARQKALADVDKQAALLKESTEKVYASLQPERDAFAKAIIEKLSRRQTSAAGASTTSASY